MTPTGETTEGKRTEPLDVIVLRKARELKAFSMKEIQDALRKEWPGEQSFGHEVTGPKGGKYLRSAMGPLVNGFTTGYGINKRLDRPEFFTATKAADGKVAYKVTGAEADMDAYAEGRVTAHKRGGGRGGFHAKADPVDIVKKLRDRLADFEQSEELNAEFEALAKDVASWKAGKLEKKAAPAEEKKAPAPEAKMTGNCMKCKKPVHGESDGIFDKTTKRWAHKTCLKV